MPERIMNVSTVIFDLLRSEKKYHTYSETLFQVGEYVTIYNDVYKEEIGDVKVTAREDQGDDYKYFLEVMSS